MKTSVTGIESERLTIGRLEQIKKAQPAETAERLEWAYGTDSLHGQVVVAEAGALDTDRP